MLLTLFPMDNEEWVVSLFAVSIYRFKDYTMFYLNLVLNYVRFFHIFLWKLITLYIILLWSICVILWLSLMTELKIRQGYSWDMTLIRRIQISNMWHFILHIKKHTIYAFISVGVLWTAFLLLCYCPLPEVLAEVPGATSGCCSRPTIGVMEKEKMPKHNWQFSSRLLTQWLVSGEEALKVIAMH